MSQTVFPTLRFNDARASIAWLEKVLGAEALEVHDDDEGRVAHAEVRIGTSLIMCGDRPDVTATPAGTSVIYVVVDDADAAHARDPHLPVLFTSGYTQSAITHQGRLDPGVHLLCRGGERTDKCDRERNDREKLSEHCELTCSAVSDYGLSGHFSTRLSSSL